MRALVTGCVGFIGSHLVDHLVTGGWEVTGVDDLSAGHVEWVNDLCDLYVADFASDEVLSLVRARSFDVVFHLAARPRVSYSVEHPLETNDTNVTKALALIEACRGNVGRFVFASSSSVYGGADQLPTMEHAPKNPRSPYALQKLVIEQYLQVYRDLYGLDSVSLRFFNVFGPRQLGDSPYSTAVSAWLDAVHRGIPLRKDGTGEQSRDMCYVSNVAQALVLAAVTSNPFGLDPVFNVGCGDSVTNGQILAHLAERYPGMQVAEGPFRPGDVMHTQADITRAEVLLGYEPVVRFWQGLDLTCRWYDEEWDRIRKMGTNA